MTGPCALALAVLCGAAGADPLPDPTRPSVPGVHAENRSAPPRVELPQLSSLLVAPSRRLAVIDGKLLAEGERGNGFTLTRIHVDGVDVVLQHTRTTHRLTLDQLSRVHRNDKER